MGIRLTAPRFALVLDRARGEPCAQPLVWRSEGDRLDPVDHGGMGLLAVALAGMASSWVWVCAAGVAAWHYVPVTVMP